MTLLNRQVYEQNPKTHPLANDGVAHVGIEDDVTPEAIEKYERVLRFELATFICDGQYQAGLETLLRNYIDRVRGGKQPAPIWLSGFYGAGKSHLAKMMAALWENYTFSDGASAESVVANLPQSIRDLLHELRAEAARHGGTRVVAGMLAKDAADATFRLVLSLVFKAAGLPHDIIAGRFTLWLKDTGYYDAVKNHCDTAGGGFLLEARHLFMSRPLADAILKCDATLQSHEKVRNLLRTQFEHADSVDATNFREDMRRALKVKEEMPLTLVVLDEAQQYLGADASRTHAIQQLAEVCQTSFDGKVQLVATGQSAMGSTEQLEKLRGRFPLTIHLTDQDQEGVIRKTVLRKALSQTAALKAVLDSVSGEISRHLLGTRIAASAADEASMVADYPILPVRRRFFEAVLRAVDVSGVISQLRNQLRIAYQAALDTSELPLGNVVGGDFIFNELQSSSSFPNLISNELFTTIRRLDGSGHPRDQLKARALKLIFLINKLPREADADIGLRTAVDALADLLVTDLHAGSTALRAELPGVLQDLEDARIIMAYEDGGVRVYREQTAESASWYADYTRAQQVLRSDTAVVESRRNELLQERVRQALAKVKAVQGALNTPRKLTVTFEDTLSVGATQQLTVWVQDGWLSSEKAVAAAAGAAGPSSPAIFVFIPDRDKSDLHDAIVKVKAAEQTINSRGEAQTSAGKDAFKMMEGNLNAGGRDIERILAGALADAKVYAGGGTELEGDTLGAKVQRGVDDALPRLYPNFAKADHKGWPDVLKRASEGVPDAMKYVEHTGDVERHPVCADLLTFIGTAGKKGADIQDHFENSTYGWPRDAVQGGLMALLCGGLLKAKDGAGAAITVRELDRKQITKTHFQAEQDKLSAGDKIAVRSVLKRAGIQSGSEDVHLKAALLGPELNRLRVAAGGPPPAPESPKAELIARIESQSGNAQLLAIARSKPELETAIDEWRDKAAKIISRMPAWDQLQKLLARTAGLEKAAELAAEGDAIVSGRALLAEPSPVAPLAHKLTDTLRTALNATVKAYGDTYATQVAALSHDEAWNKISQAQRDELMVAHGLQAGGKVDTSTADSILAELNRSDLNRWQDRMAALSGRFEAARADAARLLEPKAIQVELPRGLLRTAPEVKAWLAIVETKLLAAVEKNPIRF